jgi:rod shape determining protein RodA
MERTRIYKNFLGKIFDIDWILVLALVPILLAGLFTMNSFIGDNTFFDRQIIWIAVSAVTFWAFSLIDFKFLRRTSVIVTLYSVSILLLAFLFILGSIFSGAQSWFNFGAFAFQPSEFGKLVLVLLLAKYFSRRHVEIKNIKHIAVSGAYAGLVFLLVLLQPDFGSALVVFAIWFGMVMVSGISKKHVLLVFATGTLAVGAFWGFVFEDYQKQRIMTFIHPLEDIQGAGYNAYQSRITVGSGEIFGKGLGYGTQSRLQFLPEYETDFIFAAFAEEWGFIGVLILFLLFGIVIWRIIHNATHGATNFEILFGLGLAIMFVAHLFINIGMNIGIMPVTGITVPFMSYGGSHLLVSFVGLGILMAMRRYRRSAHKELMKNEFLGV